MPQTISPWDILTSGGKHEDREKDPECDSVVRANAADLAERVSKLLDHLGVKPGISSGFRTTQANQAAKGSKTSSHCEGKAVDLEDLKGTLAAAITADPGLLATYDLYMEHTDYTQPKDGEWWVHLSTRSTLSGRRVFVP